MTTQNNPYSIDVTAGETKHFCPCGKSNNLPFCDGSHKGTGLSPIAHTFDKDQTAYICGCAKSKNQPFCDGAHK